MMLQSVLVHAENSTLHVGFSFLGSHKPALYLLPVFIAYEETIPDDLNCVVSFVQHLLQCALCSCELALIMYAIIASQSLSRSLRLRPNLRE